MTYSTYCHSCARGNPVGVEKANFAVIPASARESRVSTITLPCRLRFLMQTNLFNYPVMQTVVFTLILWILDRVEDDKRGGSVIIPLPIVIPAHAGIQGG